MYTEYIPYTHIEGRSFRGGSRQFFFVFVLHTLITYYLAKLRLRETIINGRRIILELLLYLMPVLYAILGLLRKLMRIFQSVIFSLSYFILRF